MKIVKAIVLVFISYCTVYAQIDGLIEYSNNIQQSSIMASSGGKYKPSKNGTNEYMKALIVFVQFDSTDVDVNNSVWPKDQMPNWANSIISSSKAANYPEFTLSDYWKEMSIGTFDFIGVVYPNLVTIKSENYYSKNRYHFGQCNKDALTQINPNVDFSDYDNWGYNSTTKLLEFSPDGYVDMIVMIYRDPVNQKKWFDDTDPNFTAISVLSGSSQTYTLNFDGVNILAKRNLEYKGSGITVKKGLKGHYDMIPIIAHEYGHYLFGANHSNTSGLMSDVKNFSLNGAERERLGYISPVVCDQNNFGCTLEDFITSGDLLKIPIPISNPNSSTYFLVENHQKLCKYDQIIRGGAINGGYDFTSNIGNGVYVWLIKNGNSSSHARVDYEAVTADGRWNWNYNGDYYAGSGWYVGKSYEGYLPKTRRSSVNRHTGLTDKIEEHIYWNSHWASKWVDDYPSGSFELTRDVMGDEYDAFNFGYNELLTPWSNPSTYVNDTTNISIQLYNKSGNDIIVKVFTESASGEALPPSNPQFLKMTTNGGYHPVLTWTANTEPDLSAYQVFRKKGSGNWIAVATCTTNRYIDDQIILLPSSSILYTYKVRAKDTQNYYSQYSNEVSDRGDMIYKANSEDGQDDTPTTFLLLQNHPNPFNPTTTISYQIPEQGFVTLKVYDMLGREVADLVNNKMEAGKYSVNFNASNLASGIYIYRINVQSFEGSKSLYSKTEKMMLLK